MCIPSTTAVVEDLLCIGGMCSFVGGVNLGMSSQDRSRESGVEDSMYSIPAVKAVGENVTGWMVGHLTLPLTENFSS